MRRVWTGLLIFSAFLTASCSPGPTSLVADQLNRGQAIYKKGCATEACHGVNGEGIRSGAQFRDWPLVGEEFQRRNPTAQVIFDVVRSGGEPALRALTDQQVYDAIAYELSINGVELSEPLNGQNAPGIASGAAAGVQSPGSLFPPPGNASLIPPGWPTPALPIQAENDDLRMRLTQIGQASSIGNNSPPAGGSYALVVLTLEVLANHPLEVSPQHLRLATKDEQLLEPLEIGLGYPVARFYPQSIQPEHGTAVTAIFALPATAEMGYLQYTLPAGQPLTLELVP